MGAGPTQQNNAPSTTSGGGGLQLKGERKSRACQSQRRFPPSRRAISRAGMPGWGCLARADRGRLIILGFQTIPKSLMLAKMGRDCLYACNERGRG